MGIKTERTFVGLKLPAELLAAIDEGRGAKSRSEWIREAAVEKLAAAGRAVSESWTPPPDRAGVGGRPKQKAAAATPKPKKAKPRKPTGESKILELPRQWGEERETVIIHPDGSWEPYRESVPRAAAEEID